MLFFHNAHHLVQPERLGNNVIVQQTKVRSAVLSFVESMRVEKIEGPRQDRAGDDAGNFRDSDSHSPFAKRLRDFFESSRRKLGCQCKPSRLVSSYCLCQFRWRN